jgi:hypothetical protein
MKPKQGQKEKSKLAISAESFSSAIQVTVVQNESFMQLCGYLY